MKELLFSDFSKITKEKLSFKPQTDKWQGIPYVADGIEGVMLVAGECCYPNPIEIDLNVKGLYNVYICLGCVSNNSLVEISISGEDGKTVIKPSDLYRVNDYTRWACYEYAEEAFFKSVELTGKKIIFNKPHKFMGPVNRDLTTSSVLFIRLEEISENELLDRQAVNNNKTIQYHFDCDYYGEDDYETPEDYLGRLKMLDYGNMDSLIHEINYDYPKLFDSYNGIFYQEFREKYRDAVKQVKINKEEIFNGFAQYVHEKNAEIYVGYRMGLGDFSLPYYHLGKDLGLQNEIKEYHCELRNGKKANFLSYAYKESRKIMINNIIDNLPDNYDGVSLFFHRGICVLFEKPVCDKVKKDYGVDARTLPFTDSRLNTVLCYFITEFLRELKVALNKKAKSVGKSRYKVNAIVFYDVDSSKNFGLNVETWAKERLIDSVSQGLMTYYEDLEGTLNENGSIDVQKYIEKEQKYAVIKRCFDDKAEHIISGIKGFNDISKKYGVKFYATLCWEHMSKDYQFDMAKKIYEAGADNLVCWNANHTAKKMPVIDMIKQCGNKERVLSKKINVYRRTLRITSIDGNDISEFDVNWKG